MPLGKNNILLSDIFINPFFIIIISLFSFVIAFKKNKYFFEHLTIATYYISIFVLFSTGAVLIELIPYGYYSDNILACVMCRKFNLRISGFILLRK